jgi:hypothetical protein
MGTPSDAPIAYVMDWDRFGRKDTLCEILPSPVQSGLVQVKFRDGFTHLVNRRALRRAKQSEIEKEAKNG